MVERKMDEIPSRSELQQYQGQFLELYEQVAAKLTETRKYFQMYNTLDDTLTFLTKEISILNSIHDNFKNAMKSASLKATFLEQLQNIVNSVDGYMKRVCGTQLPLCDCSMAADRRNSNHNPTTLAADWCCRPRTS
jgi:hypothetical protein